MTTRPPEPLLDERESLAIRLLREAAPDVRRRLRQLPFVPSQLRPEARTEPTRDGRSRDGLRQALDHGLVSPEHVVGLDPERLAGDGSGDIGVAVAVARRSMSPTP